MSDAPFYEYEVASASMNADDVIIFFKEPFEENRHHWLPHMQLKKRKKKNGHDPK